MAKNKTDAMGSVVLAALVGHIGHENRIGMGELYEEVYGKRWRNRQNDTRPLRKVIAELRDQGYPIVADNTSTGGYYLSSAGSELEKYCRNLRKKALRSLKTESRLRKTTLPALLGIMQEELDMEGTEQ